MHKLSGDTNLPSNNWTREQLIIAFNLYCKIPYGTIHNRNPQIIALADLIGRTPSAVSYKLANFASYDPSVIQRGRKGLDNAGEATRQVWEEFNSDWDRLAYESERLLAELSGKPLAPVVDESVPEIVAEGKEREAVVKVRVNQSFFRATVLAAYKMRCCISGLAAPELLNASHIVPWATDKANRVNPRNGLCLNLVLDRAFDRGLLTVTPDYIVQISSTIKAASDDPAISELLLRYDGALMRVPGRFAPAPEFLRYHNGSIFKA